MIASLLTLFAGALLSLAFAPFNFYSLAFIAPAALLFIWLRSTPWQATYRGFLFGLGFFGVGTSWIYISIHNFGNASVPLAVFITGLFIVAMALYPAAQGYLFRQLFQHKSLTVQCLFVFPATWLIFEGLRAWLFTGFPWLSLGYSQVTTPLLAFTPLFSVYGVSLAVCFISGALVMLAASIKSIGMKVTAVIVIGVLMFSGWILKDRSWTQPAGKSITISLVQGNIPQRMKWQPDQLINILNIYKNLTEKLWNSQLIVWPEAAVPTFPQGVKKYYTQMNKLARQHGDYLIIGSPIYDPTTQKFYNGLQMIGRGKGRYLKRHLLPFGEYTPLTSIFGSLMKKLNIPMSNFSRGPEDQKPLRIGNYNIAAFICYEIAFSREVLRHAKNTQLLINISDDSWFGHSIALDQQVEMAQFRALEIGRPTLLSTNTGITAIINPLRKKAGLIS